MRVSKSLAIATGAALSVGLTGLSVAAQDTPGNLSAEEQVQQDVNEQPASAEEYIRDVLNLTDEQATQIQEIFASYEEPIATARAEYSASLERLDSVLMPETPSATISEAYRETSTSEQALYDLLFARNLAIRDVLNVDQRSQINTFVRSLLDLEVVAIVTPAEPVVPFPENLVGRNIDSVIRELEAEGWTYAADIAGTVYLDKEGQELQLDLGSDNLIEAAYLQ